MEIFPEKFSNNKAVFVTVVLIVTMLVAVKASGVLQNPSPEVGRNNLEPEGGYPVFNYSYKPEKEHLAVKLTGNPFIAETGGLMLENRSYRPAFLLNTSEREKKTNIWARTKLANVLHAESDVSLANTLRNFGHPGVADFPVRTGAELLIKKDFTDKDGDDIQGIENNETITLFAEQPSGKIEKFAYVSIVNNTVRTYRLDPYSDQRWTPCSKPREGCTIPGLYKFTEKPRSKQ